MAGRKSKILIDSIDLEILELLTKSKPLGVLELTKKIGLTHPNAKAHLEKLIKSGLVTTINQDRKIELTTIASNSFMEVMKDASLTRKESDGVQKSAEDLKILIEILRKIKYLDTEKETIRNIISDLENRREFLKKNKV